MPGGIAGGGVPGAGAPGGAAPGGLVDDLEDRLAGGAVVLGLPFNLGIGAALLYNERVTR